MAKGMSERDSWREKRGERRHANVAVGMKKSLKVD